MGIRLPAIEGVIRRRVLANWIADPDAVARLLPEPLRPKVVRGAAVAGVCLIRLEDVRAAGAPRALGLSSENAAHRIAVLWDEDGETREGVYVLRRDTSSPIQRLAGGRLFPGAQHAARFEVEDDGRSLHVSVRSSDGRIAVDVAGREAAALPPSSHFLSLEESSTFFRGGAIGWNRRRDGGLEGMELCADAWVVRPLEVERAVSSVLSDAARFPPGTTRFDHALVMRDVPHRWRVPEVAAPASPCRVR